MLGKPPQLTWSWDFAKAFDKVDHGLLLHKLKDLGITGNLALGAVSNDHALIGGVPQDTAQGRLLFFNTIAGINKDMSSSKIISFADGTRLID